MRKEISKINFNLLKTLVILLETCHVSKTAEQLHVTQAAISRSLAQLREIFNDELLIRTKNKMLPTEKALQLLPEVKELIHKLDAFFETSSYFDPRETVSQFTIGMSDYAQLLLLPKLMNGLQTLAPQARLNIVNRTFIRNQSEFESGVLDLMVGYISNPPENMMHRQLWEDDLVCLVHQDSKLSKIKLTPKNFFSFRYIVISYNDEFGSSNTLQYLRKYNDLFEPTLTVQTIASACLILCQTDMILIATKEIAKNLMPLLPIKILPYPFPSESRKVAMYWHKRFNRSPSHRWLREQIAVV